jgi:hypothetical protein
MKVSSWLAVTLVILAGGAAPDNTVSGAEDAVAKEFGKRLDSYQSIRKKAAKGVPRLPDKASPEQIKARANKLQTNIRTLRAGAKPGDVLTPAVFELIAAVRAETAGKAGRSARETVLGEGNPTKEGAKVALKINAPYPADAPLSTVPPELLARMPALPEGLQYRFVGKNLILYDAEADLIVDFLSQAVH